MYKCNVCSKNYIEKPEFCDCGNDDFTELKDIKPSDKSNTDNKSHTKKEKKYITKEDVFSIFIFILCIILSIVSIIFIGNEKPVPKQEFKQEIKTVYVEPPKEEPIKEQVKSPEKKKEINQEIISEEKITIKENKTTDLFSAAKTEKTKSEENIKSQTKTQTNPQTNIKPPKEEKTKVQKNNTTTTAQIKQKSTKNVQRASTQTQNTVNQQTNTTEQEQDIKNIQKNKNNIKQLDMLPTLLSEQEVAQQKKEFGRYKIALRNKIASNINFGAIVGDGDCVITFKISKKGEITDRKFSKLSKNGSLNDNVYIGMMKTPAYNPPPLIYKNETLKLYVKMYGGKFEVTLN